MGTTHTATANRLLDTSKRNMVDRLTVAVNVQAVLDRQEPAVVRRQTALVATLRGLLALGEHDEARKVAAAIAVLSCEQVEGDHSAIVHKRVQEIIRHMDWVKNYQAKR